MAVVTHSLTHSLTRRLLMLWRRSLPAFTLFWFVALSLSLLRCFVAFVAFVALLLFVCSFVRSFVVFVRCLGVVVESLLGGRWVVGPLLVGVAGCPGRGRGRGRRGCVRADGSIPSALPTLLFLAVFVRRVSLLHKQVALCGGTQIDAPCVCLGAARSAVAPALALLV